MTMPDNAEATHQDDDTQLMKRRGHIRVSDLGGGSEKDSFKTAPRHGRSGLLVAPEFLGEILNGPV